MIRAAFTLALALSTASAARAGDVLGLWKTPGNGGLVRIEPCDEEICGRAVDSDPAPANPDQTGAHAPDSDPRGRTAEGELILKVRPLGADRWGAGWVYNPRDGAHYHATVRLESPTRLKLTGCLFPPLCRSQIWTRSDGS